MNGTCPFLGRLSTVVPLQNMRDGWMEGRVQTNISASITLFTAIDGRAAKGASQEWGGGAKEHKVTSCVAALLNIKVSGKSKGEIEGACISEDGNMDGDISAPDCMPYVTRAGFLPSFLPFFLSNSCSSW